MIIAVFCVDVIYKIMWITNWFMAIKNNNKKFNKKKNIYLFSYILKISKITSNYDFGSKFSTKIIVRHRQPKLFVERC